MTKELGGIIAILTTVLLMAMTDALIKVFMGDVSLWQLFLARSPFVLIMLVALAVILPGENLARAFASFRDPWVLLRSFIVILMYLFMYMSFPYLHLAVMGAAVLIAPIFTALMSALLLRDRVGLRGWIGVALGFIGVLVISRPGSDVFQPAIVLPVIAGLCYSMTAVLTRAKLQHVSTIGVALALNSILLAFSGGLVLLLTFLPPPEAWVEQLPFMLRGWAPMSGSEWGVIIIMAVLTGGFTVLLTLAYQIGQTVVIATLEYSYLVFAGLIGFLFLGEVLDGFSVLGMMILTAAGALVATRSATVARR